MRTFRIARARVALLVATLACLVGSVARAARYGFESGEDGWTAQNWGAGQDKCTNVVQSSFWGYGGSTNSLRMDCVLTGALDTAVAGVTFSPVNLQGSQITVRVYCPDGSSGTGQPWSHTQLRIFVKDKNYAFQQSAWDAFLITNGISTQTLTHTVTGYDWQGNPFDSTNVTEFGVFAVWRGYGTYNGPLYLDEAGFGAPYQPEQTITNSQHHYDMEAESQKEYWKWDTNPQGWNAQAWTNVHYVTNQGVNGSVALAANATFVTNGGDAARKGVFEIAYQPALNLSTKDHRKIQAKLRFDPAAPGANNFYTSINVFDKLTDQWYARGFNVDGAGTWTFLDFDLDQAGEYSSGSPVPMSAEAIGFVVIQIYANVAWTGTVYVDDVIVGGRETGTNFTRITSGFAQPAGHKFMIGGTNFYFCGANIEYLQTVSDAAVEECLDWASSNGLQIVRTWAMQEGKPYSFQPQRGVWNELMFEHLDRIVAEASHRNIRLMLGLVDNWAHNGGIFQYVHWATREHPESVDTNLNKEGVVYHDQFWTNQWCKQWYKDYVTRLLNRTNSITGVIYKNDPTVFAWEIVNEPRCESDFGGGKIHRWLNEMSDWVRTIDTNHMLGNGEEGGYVNTYDFADTIPWEIYPDNYYHYAAYATGSSTCDLYGCGRGHGVDFISDNNTLATFVQWQGGLYTNREPTNSEWRAGNSNINFTTARIYVDQKEYNVWRTNVVGADQRLEWINDHWYDAHETIGKPMILEEFGIHAIGWIFNGSYGQVQLQRTPEYTLQDRVNIYSQYYDHIEQSGISGSFFWNFGYRGMWDDAFHLCEQVAPWYASTSDSVAVSVTLSQNYVQQGSNSLQFSWDATNAGSRALFKCPTNEEWLLRVDNSSTNEPPTHGVNRTKFFWSFYNPGPANLSVSLAIVGGPNEYWCEQAPRTLTSGWNRITFDLSGGNWGWVSNGWAYSEYLIHIPNAVSNVLENVKQVGLVVRDLPAGAGSVYVDNIQIKRDDGFVIYADDPVNPVIKAHAQWCAARNVATNAPANNAPVASNLFFVVDPFVPTPIALAGSDADGDSLSYRIIQRPQQGWAFGTPPGNMVYSPKLGASGSDSFTYVVHDGKRDSAEAVVTIVRGNFDFLRYDFEAGSAGWYANYKPNEGYAVTGVVASADRAFHGTNSLKAWINMNPTWPTNAGDAEVDMLYDAPENLLAPLNLTEQPLQISIYCPAGSRGNPSNPNRIQIYAKDTNWLAEYTFETNIVEDAWITHTMTVSTNTPPGGWKAPGFRPDEIRALGVRIKCGGAGSSYTGPIYIDAVRFPVMERHLLYGFTTNTEGWATENWGFGDALLSWTPTGNPNAGALVVTPSNGTSYGKFYIKDWDKVENENLFYRPLLRAYVWVPCDAPANVHHAVQVRLVVRSSTDGWQYGHQSEQFLLTPCQWNLITWDLSSLPLEILTDVDEFGMEIVWQNRDVWQGPVFVDSIQASEQSAAAAPAILSVSPATNTVGRYKKFEVTVGLGNVEGLNPYDPHQVDLRGTFTSPSGQAWHVNGFYMEDPGDAPGQGKFRIRFAPNELGSWSYQVSAGNAQGTNSSSSSSFTCVTSDRHGWLRVSDDDGHYLEHDDDSPFVGIGYCRAWDGDDEGFFREAEEHGINMIHWWMAPWDTMLTVKPANPNESWREKSSYDTYEQTRAAELDRVVGHAEKYNVKLVWTIWPHDAIRDFNYHKWRLNGSWQRAFDQKFSEPEWYINAFSELDDPAKNQKFFYDGVYEEYQDRLYRYIIARWGYSEAIGTWALVSEFFGTFANSLNCIRYQDPLYVTNKNALFGENPYLNMDPNQCDGSDYTVPWLTYINSYFKTNDPFRHPTTASYATDEYWDEGMSIVDIAQIHVYADLYNWITPPVTLKKYHNTLHEEYDKPAFMGEIGTVEWKLYEPDYTRVTAWPGICAGAAITPMMWTTPPFSWFGDSKMGPWLGVMSDEMKVLADFVADINFPKLDLRPADANTTAPNEPPVTLVESFESGTNGWRLWGNGITSGWVTNAHATAGTNAWRLNVDMGTYAQMPDPASGIDKYEDQGLSYDWSNYWPRGTLKMDVFIPEFYHPTNNPDGFLLGINKDPRSIVEVFTKDAGDNWHWYSTTNEYGGALRESGGWKKLTVGMLWNLELPLSHIPTAYEAAHIAGIKFKFGDVGILKGPIYIDNITAGLYAYNTLAMVSSNGQFAFGWIQDRRWTNTVVGNSGATLTLNGLAAGNYNVEWWDTLVGPRETVNASAPTGTLAVTVPNFQKDLAFKVRRIGSEGATVHDVAVASVQEYDWVVRNPRQLLEVMVENQGTASETFNVVLTDTTAGQVVGTNAVTLAAGASVHTRFWWNCLANPTDAYHVLTAAVPSVPGEADTADNTMSGKTMVYARTPPWDPCNALRRWGPDANDSDGRRLTVTTNHASEGTESFEFYHRSPSKYQAYFGFDQVYENWSNRTSFAFDLYNADGSTNAQILMRAGSNWVWYYSAVVTITNGWNQNITFRFDTNTWTKSVWNDETQQNDYFYNVPAGGLEEMQQLFIKVAGYTNDGSVYVDNMRLDGWYTLKLGMVNNVDVFPNAVAEQSNYTGAASCWMAARYMKGDSFTQSQAQIYAATAHDPAHNNEITPQSAASWLYANVPPGYYFSPRYRTSLTDALKETVYWMDYVPAGGLQTPVEILSGTGWSYKVVRGFQTSTKPYGSLYSLFTVHGMWLKDPRLGGLGYDVYATAQEMENVYLPSTANGEYWFICEPPPDAAAVSEAVDRMDGSTVILGGGEPNPELAAQLKSLFAARGGPGKTSGGSSQPPGGITNLLSVVPEALKGDLDFMAAYQGAPAVTYYEVNQGLVSHYYLAAGGVYGPGSVKYVIKLAPDGSFQQATWAKATALYPFVPVEAAVWTAEHEVPNGTVISTQLVYAASASPSPFLPAWEVLLQQGAVTITNDVAQDDPVTREDSDGDGMTDAEELYAGVDPTNRLSAFRPWGAGLNAGGAKIVITWPSLSGRTYSVCGGTNLAQRFPVRAAGVPATPPLNTYTDAPPAATMYYRIEVE